MTSRMARTVRGIVLAGVHQWDDAAIDAVLPRPLLPVAQMPLIGYALQWLRGSGVTQATVCANSASRLVRRCLGDGGRLGMELDYYEDWTPRGPAGCVRDAGAHGAAETYVVTDGTIIPVANLADLLTAHRQSDAALTVAVHGGVGPAPSPVGIFVFERDVLAQIPVLGYQDIKEVLIPRLRAGGARVATHAVGGPCPRVTDFDSYLAVNAWVVERLADGAVPPGFAARGAARVHVRAHVAESAVLMGPVIVGAGARVAARATVVGPAVLGAGSVVAARAVVCRSVLWDRCHIAPDALVDECVVGHDVCVEPGTHLYARYLAPVPAANRTIADA